MRCSLEEHLVHVHCPYARGLYKRVPQRVGTLTLHRMLNKVATDGYARLVPASDTDGRNKVMDAHKPPSIKQIATFGSLYNEGAFAVSEQHVIARRRR